MGAGEVTLCKLVGPTPILATGDDIPRGGGPPFISQSSSGLTEIPPTFNCVGEPAGCTLLLEGEVEAVCKELVFGPIGVADELC